jgi:hypothetical protein
MAIAFEYGGLLREYELVLPVGFDFWFPQCAGAGFPLVVAFHGYGQEVESFKADWDFATIMNTSSATADKFVAIYPYGLSVVNEPKSLVKPWSPPARFWNSHPDATPLDADDPGFVEALVDHAAGIVASYLSSRGVNPGSPPAVFDVKRKHLFGYSNGAFLALRCASVHTDVWSSVVVVAGANGAKSNAAATEYRFPPNGGVGVGTRRCSLWLNVGLADDTVRPGDVTLDPTADPDTFLPSYTDRDSLAAAGVPVPQRTNLAGHTRKANHTVRDYLLYQQAQFANFNTNYALPSASGSSLPGVTGANTRAYREWTRPSPNSDNPRVRLEFDSTMTHTNVTGPNRWLTAASVWSFMKSVPRP